MTEKEHNPKKENRNWMLQNIKLDYLVEMATFTNYTGSIKDNDAINTHLLNINDAEFANLEEEYIDSKNSSNYIFILKSDEMDKIKANFHTILNRMDKIPKEENAYIYIDHYRFVSDLDELRIRLISLKMGVITKYWDFENNKIAFYRGDEIIPIPIRILFSKNLIFVKTKSDKVAHDIQKLINSKFDIKMRKLHFNKNDIYKITCFMQIFRSANVRYEDESEMQSAHFNAGEKEANGTLKNLKKSPKFQNASKGGNIRNAIYSNAKNASDTVEELKRADVITLGINFIEGKIYFKTRLTERLTRDWICDILSQINYNAKLNDENLEEELLSEEFSSEAPLDDNDNIE